MNWKVDTKPDAEKQYFKLDKRTGVGDWRILFTPDWKRKIIYVYAKLPRGDAYKN